MRYLVKLLFILSFCWISPAAFAALSTADEVAQTQNLEALSIAWGDTGPANTIFTKPEYTAADWEAFFNKYFNCAPACAGNSTAIHSYTDGLYNYLGYPVFYWFDNTVHLKLQTALVNPLWTKINNSMSPYITTLGTAMVNDVGLRQSLFNSHRFFANLAQYGIVDMTIRTTVYDNYKSHIGQYLQYFSDARTMGNTQPWVASLKAQVWMSFGSTLPLTTALATDIATTISLRNQKLTIWNTFNVLIIDDNGLDTAQLSALSGLLNSIPPGLNPLRYLTVSEFFDQNAGPVPGAWAVNIFGVKLGAAPGNPFPSDVAPINGDLFMSAAAHEFNHIVDATYVKGDPVRSARLAQIISQMVATQNDLQNLRSNVGWIFFRDAPQEFFASISNDYFTDSWHTLDLGLCRFNGNCPFGNGVSYKEPINQFLFFADTYTKGSSATKVYTTNASGTLTVNAAAVGRDANGRIVSLRRDDATNHVTYQFTLDTNGNVTAYNAVYDAPTVSSTVVSNIKSTTSTLTATVNTNGGTGRAYAQCLTGTGTYASYGITPLPQQPINGPVVFDITGLIANTAYTCRIGAWNNNTDSNAVATPVTFTTLAYPLPTATTGTASAVARTSATLNGTCNFNGAAGTAVFEYWNTRTPTTITTTATQSFLASSTSYPVVRGITGLSSATNYAFRIKCTNVSGSSTGATSLTFKTAR